MANVYYRIRGKSDNESIYLQLTINRDNRFEKKTGLSIASKDWSRSTKLPKKNIAQNKELETTLRDLRTFILKEESVSQVRGETINIKWLANRIDIHFKRISPSGRSELVLDAIDHVISTAPYRKGQRGNKGLSKTRIDQYKRLKNLFDEFQGTASMKIRDIDQAAADAFYQYLIDEGNYAESYSLKMVDNLKTICKDAQSLGITVSPQLEKIGGGKPSNTHIIYLKPEELQKIKQVNLEQEYLDNARKWLLFGCYVGQRVSDLLRITEKMFRQLDEEEQVIELRQIKTGKDVTIPVLPETKEVISDGFPRPISAQNFNRYIKVVCKKAGITQQIEGGLIDKNTGRKVIGMYPKYMLITSHVCRRSFATNHYGDLYTPLIMQVTGHTTEKSLNRYIGRSGIDSAKLITQYFKSKRNKT
jgi:integrase